MKHGLGNYKMPWQERFKQRFFTDRNGCWVWTGRKQKKTGTACFSIDNKSSTSAIKLAHEVKYGEKRTHNLRAIRACKNRDCINPDHFINGDNERIRGSGERNKEMRSLYEKHLKYKDYTLSGLGRKYGLSRQRIEQIVKGIRK